MATLAAKPARSWTTPLLWVPSLEQACRNAVSRLSEPLSGTMAFSSRPAVRMTKPLIPERWRTASTQLARMSASPCCASVSSLRQVVCVVFLYLGTVFSARFPLPIARTASCAKLVWVLSKCGFWSKYVLGRNRSHFVDVSSVVYGDLLVSQL